MKKPAIILVPGSWHTGVDYFSLTTRLQQAGYDVHALDMPSTSGSTSQDIWKDDVAYIRSIIVRLCDAAQEVVVVMHSRGGQVGGDAVENLGKSQRTEEGKSGGVIRMLYICAFALAEGVTLFDATKDPPSWIHFYDERSMMMPMTVGKMFYSDCSADLVEKQAERLRPVPTGTMSDHKVEYAAWKHLPSTYLICEQDNALPMAAQEAMISQPGAHFDVERCAASHSPFHSMPDFTAQVVRRAAGEQI
ncbi:hypothetical protein B0A50_02648 [Salinomyces thailandicus]|uniref:AB hydrolase-1 domain-containing protein n=1 Tax=Salinomyces thailandicus TaxID=706561 RepID=A0A4U0U5J2_9PEZI|nr:hypothetical protein B0A50_02648 [Salinomyces thailandica]